MVDSDDLIDSDGVAELLGLAQRSSVTTYLRRYADMPRPIVDRGPGRVRLWSAREMERWARSTGRSPDAGT